LAEKIREWPTTRLIDAEGERVLRDAVRVNDAELGVEHDDADRERIEQIRGLEMGKYRGRVVLKRQGPLRVRPARERRRESNSVPAKGGLQERVAEYPPNRSPLNAGAGNPNPMIDVGKQRESALTDNTRRAQ
jgi:hypothetical protein